MHTSSRRSSGSSFGVCPLFAGKWLLNGLAFHLQAHLALLTSDCSYVPHMLLLFEHTHCHTDQYVLLNLLYSQLILLSLLSLTDPPPKGLKRSARLRRLIVRLVVEHPDTMAAQNGHLVGRQAIQHADGERTRSQRVESALHSSERQCADLQSIQCRVVSQRAAFSQLLLFGNQSSRIYN